MGLYVGQPGEGDHTFDVKYRTPASGISNVVDGSDWQTRALTVAVLPAPVSTDMIVPTDPVTLSASNQWTSWPGLQTSIDVPADDNLVLITFQTANEAKSTHVLSKLYIDGAEIVGTRSIAGNQVYGSNLGMYLGTLSAGTHALDVKYRTPGAGITNGGGDWTTRALTATVLPPAEGPVTNLNPQTPYALSSSNAWTSWDGLQSTVSVPGNCVVMATYQTANEAKESHVLSKLYVDGAEVRDGRSREG